MERKAQGPGPYVYVEIGRTPSDTPGQRKCLGLRHSVQLHLPPTGHLAQTTPVKLSGWHVCDAFVGILGPGALAAASHSNRAALPPWLDGRPAGVSTYDSDAVVKPQFGAWRDSWKRNVELGVIRGNGGDVRRMTMVASAWPS